MIFDLIFIATINVMVIGTMYTGNRQLTAKVTSMTKQLDSAIKKYAAK